MIEQVEIIQINELNEPAKKQVLALWNNEYPEKIAYNNMNEFDSYLQSLTNLTHFLLTNQNNQISGWALTFDRAGERWFSVIITENIKGKGWGRKMLDKLKQTESVLNGWATDHANDKKINGQQYISPIGFYEKCGFEILHEVRLELDKISAVKIRWTNKK